MVSRTFSFATDFYSIINQIRTDVFQLKLDRGMQNKYRQLAKAVLYFQMNMKNIQFSFYF